MEPQAVLRTFGQLAAERTDDIRTNVLSSGSTFLWQRYKALAIFKGSNIKPSGMPVEVGLNKQSSLEDLEHRVLSTAKLHEGERQLYVGWIWFSGTLTTEDGVETTYCFPLVSVPVDFVEDKVEWYGSAAGDMVSGDIGGWSAQRRKIETLTPAGDVDLTDLVTGTEDRARLLNRRNFGEGKLNDLYSVNTNEYTPVSLDVFPDLTNLNDWIDDAAKTIGLPVTQIKAAHQGHPVATVRNDFITLHIGSALYVEPPVSLGARSDSLVALGRLDGIETSAMGTLYRRTPVEPVIIDSLTQLRPLSVKQRAIASEAVGSDLTVLTGAPGTGKSHVLSVVAMNAVARGESVLVVAGSPHAVDVLAEHLASCPGPPPVVFGGSRHGQQIARDLSELASREREAPRQPVHSPGGDLGEHERTLAATNRLLEVELEAVRIQRDPTKRLELVEARNQAGDLEELADMIESCEKSGASGWLARKRHLKTIARRIGDAGDHQSVLDHLRRGAEAQRLLADGGLSLRETYDSLIEHEADAARHAGRNLTADWHGRIGTEERAALAKISTALTSSRTVRRDMFAEIAPAELTTAAPLWVGSIRDVEDVLPQVVGMFDLLLIDEAAQIDQLNAVNALVRAKRAVVCGDPRQLGHVAYMNTDDLRAMAKQDPTDEQILNVGQMSLYDVAASRVPSLVLDEHFRSVPHIIEFSARRMYDGRLHVVGRNPSNEAADHIHVEVVGGSRDSTGVNTAEVEACIRVGERMIEEGHRSIGFLSPFEEQAQALEEAILDRWRLEEIDAYGLRVGTVHGFQGDERDVIIASWAIGPDEGQNIWSHINQPNLFNVMVTRARYQVIVVASTPEPPGLAGDYLRWSEPLTNLLRDVASEDRWVNTVADVLREAGLPVRVGYPVGRHLVDLVVGEPDNPIAIDCIPHPDGPASHTDRALQLRRLGWRTTDVFESKWHDRLGELAIELEYV